MGNVVFDHQPLDDLLPTMAYTCRVQLAVYDSPCPSQHLSPFENKIGGYPVSLREFGTPYSISIYMSYSTCGVQDFFSSCLLSSPPTCKCCGGPSVLLVQIYCPHEGSPYHRLLHVYCCCQIACWSKTER